jgi:hypothetical protein
MMSWISWIVTAGTWLFQLIASRKSPIVQVAKDDGENAQRVSDLESAVKTEASVASAEANAPCTVADVDDRLSRGTF